MARLLLVDDDEPTRLICRRFLKRLRADIEIVEAPNGEAAIEALRGARFDCVLSDYRMGVASGIDVLRFALEHHPETRRCLMTGFADPSLEAAARAEAQVHEFIEKPLSTEEMRQMLTRHVLPHLPRLEA